MRREIALVMLGLLLGAAGFKMGTALFSDVSLSEKNELSTGEFDIRISKTGDRFYNDLKLFEFDNLKPGDEVNTSFYIKNNGDVEVSKILMTLEVQDLEDGALTDAESSVDSTPEEGELSKSVIVEKILITKGDETYTLDGCSGKSLYVLNNRSISLLKAPLAPSETLKVSVFLLVDPNAGNEIQKDLSLVSLQIYAEQ